MRRIRSVLMIFLSCIFIFTSSAFAQGKDDGSTLSISKEKAKWSNDKVVYLTFDDGPTQNTLKVLKILEDEDVNATFFVIGKLAEQNPDIIKAEVEKGNEVCIHTYSHEGDIYRSCEAYLKDYHKAYDTVTDILGHEPSKFMRMPGGSSTHATSRAVLKSIRDNLCSEGAFYVDWNISLEDAIYQHTPVSRLIGTFNKEIKKSYIDPNTAVVLMHDGASNTTTPEALPSVIKYFKDNDYTFKTFGNANEDDIERLLHQRQINRYNQKALTDKVKTSTE